MKQKKIPLRMCIVTREKLPKNELIRIVRTNEGEPAIDIKGKMNGRGCYLKKDIEVIKKAKAKKTINHELGINIPDEIYEELINIIK